MNDKPKLVNETKKILDRFRSIMNGKGLLIGRDVDQIDYKDKDGDELEFVNYTKFPPSVIKSDEYDYVISIMFGDPSIFIDVIEPYMDIVKSNGFLILYMPHKHYYPFRNSVLPKDILLDLKHIEKYMFEIIDFQSYGYEGSYSSQDHERVEYGFHILIKKANNLFGKKDLSDDPGQMMSLE